VNDRTMTKTIEFSFDDAITDIAMILEESSGFEIAEVWLSVMGCQAISATYDGGTTIKAKVVDE